MINKPLLSICIPTYNRSDYLVRSIQSIISQEEFKSQKVEIVISDNASTDDTESVGKMYSDKYENIYYFHNDHNINNDNFPMVLSKGHGVYRRLCNDTLCFRSGSLNYICDIIKRYESTKPVIGWPGTKGKAEIQEFDFRCGIREFGYLITAIACFGIWDSECENIENDKKGAELLLWQVRKTLELSCKKDSIVLINKQLTETQPVENKNMSYGLFHVFYHNYFELFDPYFKDGSLSIDDREYLEEDLLFHFFMNWCLNWEMNSKKVAYSATENLKEMVWHQYEGKPYWKKFLLLYKIKKVRLYTKTRWRRFLPNP